MTFVVTGSFIFFLAPPLESSPGQSPEFNFRPRLQSLILQEEESSHAEAKKTVNFGCCRVPKKYFPSFPDVIDPQSKN